MDLKGGNRLFGKKESSLRIHPRGHYLSGIRRPPDEPSTSQFQNPSISLSRNFPYPEAGGGISTLENMMPIYEDEDGTNNKLLHFNAVERC